MKLSPEVTTNLWLRRNSIDGGADNGPFNGCGTHPLRRGRSEYRRISNALANAIATGTVVLAAGRFFGHSP
jgi:hypothetical protein